MNKYLAKFIHQAKGTALNTGEKQAMRQSLELFMEDHPVRNERPVRHLWQAGSKPFFLIPKYAYMTILLIAALLVGGGTSFAAAGSLPGDTLYPVKVHVNEEVRAWFAVSSVSQAQWDAHRAERRLDEAARLAAEGRLTAEASADIEARFAAHARAVQDRAARLEAKQDTHASLGVRSDFEASLKAHERVLANLESKDSARVDVKPVLVDVRAKLDSSAQARGNTETKISAEANADVKAAAEGKLKAAENKIDEVERFIADADVSATVKAQAEARLNAAEAAIVRGKAELTAEAYGKAFVTFQEAHGLAQEAKLLVATSQRLEVNVNGSDASLDIKSQTKSDTDVKITPPSVEIKGEGKTKIDLGL
ncbi:MAG: hypothetical protein HY461_01945 [Parcubacteria group bacterium]|nr:hypothetical protein [Parcubacteria group bacterium]